MLLQNSLFASIALLETFLVSECLLLKYQTIFTDLPFSQRECDIVLYVCQPLNLNRQRMNWLLCLPSLGIVYDWMCGISQRRHQIVLSENVLEQLKFSFSQISSFGRNAMNSV